MKLDTVFDLSSLTKVLATTIAVMMLTRDGKLKLDDRVTRDFSQLRRPRKGSRDLSPSARALFGADRRGGRFTDSSRDIERGGKVNFMSSPGAKQWIYEEIHREKPEAPLGHQGDLFGLEFHHAWRGGRAASGSSAAAILPRAHLIASSACARPASSTSRSARIAQAGTGLRICSRRRKTVPRANAS